MSKGKLPDKVRLSLGSASALGLTHCRLDAKPTTIYLLTYFRSKCVANCAFCPQARTSKSRADMLSRVSWPAFQTKKVIVEIGKAFEDGKIKRVCIQALNYPNVVEDILSLAKSIQSSSEVPISVSCQPLKEEEMVKLAEAGVDRVSVALDASTKELFEKIKGSLNSGPYDWENHLEALEEAVKTFGRGSVTTHLIVGLGESEEDLARIIQWCVDNGIYPGLFAFTPISGTAMEDYPAPSIGVYRTAQLAQYLITHRLAKYSKMTFTDGHLIGFGVPGKNLQNIIETGEPFRTSGCPGCNRPYYNERPGGLIYNYPKKPRPEEIDDIKKQIGTMI